MLFAYEGLCFTNARLHHMSVGMMLMLMSVRDVILSPYNDITSSDVTRM